MRTLDLDLENNEFDNFISRRRSKSRKGGILSKLRGSRSITPRTSPPRISPTRGATTSTGVSRGILGSRPVKKSSSGNSPKIGGFGAAIAAKLGRCITQVATQNPEFAGLGMDTSAINALSASEKTRYQGLMAACLSKKKTDPNRPAGSGVRIIRPTDYTGMAQSGMSQSQINRFKRAEQKRIDNAKVSTTMPPPFMPNVGMPPIQPPPRKADPSLGLDTPDVLPDSPDVLPTTGGEMPPPRPAVAPTEDKKGKMKNYLLIGGLIVAAFIIYKSVK